MKRLHDDPARRWSAAGTMLRNGAVATLAARRTMTMSGLSAASPAVSVLATPPRWRSTPGTVCP